MRITAQDDNSSGDVAGVKTYSEDIIVVVEDAPYENCFVGEMQDFEVQVFMSDFGVMSGLPFLLSYCADIEYSLKTQTGANPPDFITFSSQSVNI